MSIKRLISIFVFATYCIVLVHSFVPHCPCCCETTGYITLLSKHQHGDGCSDHQHETYTLSDIDFDHNCSSSPTHHHHSDHSNDHHNHLPGTLSSHKDGVYTLRSDSSNLLKELLPAIIFLTFNYDCLFPTEESPVYDSTPEKELLRHALHKPLRGPPMV